VTDTVELQNTSDAPLLTTSFAFRAAVVAAGATQETAQIFLAPVTNEEQRRIYWLPGGVNTTLTAAMMRYDIIAADNPAMTTLLVPPNATLGLDFSDSSIDHKFYAQNCGAGGLTVNFTAPAALTNNYYSLAIESEGPFHREYCYFTRAANVWGVT